MGMSIQPSVAEQPEFNGVTPTYEDQSVNMDMSIQPNVAEQPEFNGVTPTYGDDLPYITINNSGELDG